MRFKDGRPPTTCSSTLKKKTKSLLVHGKCIPAKLDDFTPLRLGVKIDDSVIEQVSPHKILGVFIHSQMNYESHIDELCKKLSKRIAPAP